MERGDINPVLALIKTSTVLEDAASHADLVVEAVFEDLELKRSIFGRLDSICHERVTLASNSSGFGPSEYASATKRPERFAGAHYLYPPHLLPLVKIVRGERTSDETVAVVYSLLKATGKNPVVVQHETPGFIVNRLQTALQREALYLVEQGTASAQDVDIAVRASFGRRLPFVGPFESVEIQGDLQTLSRVFDHIVHSLCSLRKPSPVLKEKIRRGEIGAKAGRGFYEWTQESLDASRRKLLRLLREG